MKRLAFAVATLLSLPASAQSASCTDREQLVANLTRLGEAQSGFGLSTRGQVLEIWTSEQTGSWTIVMSHTTGMACIMSFGGNWTGPALGTVSLPGQPT